MIKPIIFYIKNKETGEKRKRYIGNIIEKNGGFIYQKNINPEKHKYLLTTSYAIDAKIFKNKILGVCQRIEIYDTKNNILYVTTPEKFKEKGDYKHFIDKDGWDYRAEIFMPISEFQIIMRRSDNNE